MGQSSRSGWFPVAGQKRIETAQRRLAELTRSRARPQRGSREIAYNPAPSIMNGAQ